MKQIKAVKLLDALDDIYASYEGDRRNLFVELPSNGRVHVVDRERNFVGVVELNETDVK